jgi:serine/threonine-protein kinase
VNARAPSFAPVQPGDTLRSKYCVEQLIGQGGMAYVVAARHLHLEQRVAIKLLRPEMGEHAEVIARFLREARAVSRIESPHVARVLDVDTLDTGLPFIVMELLEGRDLNRIREEQRALAPHDAARWVREACLGVAEAHAQGIIHRDLKPSNLFLARKKTGEDVIKVLDFGISKLIEDTRITQAAVGMGSAAYMSPEQMRSATDVDARSDVWSLGVSLYELVTGKAPFSADTVAMVCTAVLMDTPAPPRARRPDLPPGLEAVILRCLEKDPSRRFASVSELADALAPFATATPIDPPSTPWSQQSVPGLPQPPAPASVAQPARRGVPWPAIAAGVLVALIVGVIAYAAGHGGVAAKASPARFQLTRDTLYDQETKLTWQRTPAVKTMDWTAAKAHCPRVGPGYRLPEVEELTALLAVAAADPPIDAANFSTTPIDVFWSATAAGPGAAMVVRFSEGRRGTSVITAQNRVRCVKAP